jgi:putative hydrolase of the HAD superfamily
MDLKAVFFDMGGTLERFWYTPEDRLQATPGMRKLLASAGIDLDLNDAELCDVISTGERRYHDWSIDTNEELAPARVWTEFILTGYPVDQVKLASAAEELTIYFERHFYQRELRPEVPSVLESIRRMDLKIGLISNVCSRGFVPVTLDQYGIRKYFTPMVLSSEYGRRKPDPAIFHYAARLANVPTSGCIYIGDRIARDIIGAHKAGFSLAVQIQNDFKHGEKDNVDVPDAIIKNMNEFLEIVEAEYRKSDYKMKTDASNGIRAFLFDAGDILYYRRNAGKQLSKYLKTHGIDPKSISKTERIDLRNKAFRGQMDQDQYREAVLNLHGLFRPEDIEQGKRIMIEAENDVQFVVGVPKTLRMLKDRGFLLGVITDTAQPLHVKLKWFERGGFGNVWDTIVSSNEMGVSKPNPSIYEETLRQLGLRPDQAVFVGHMDYELEGANAVGMKTVAFNYKEGACADFYIKKFPDLLKVPLVSQPGE